MKKLSVAVVCLVFSAYALATSVTLNWTQSNSPDIVCNKVYWGPVSGGPYTHQYRTKQPATTATMRVAPSGTWYCVVTAIDSQGMESTVSNEVEVLVP